MAQDLSEMRFLTVAEVADMIHSGELPAVRFGRSFRIPESAVASAVSPEISEVG